MVPGALGFARLDRLGVRLVLLLGLALLPVGIMTMMQTWRVLSEANRRVDSSLLGESLNASAVERRVITRMIGLADSLALNLPEMMDDTSSCSAYMVRMVRDTPIINFAGFTDTTGQLVCGSQRVGQQVAEPDVALMFSNDTEGSVRVAERTAITDAASILIRKSVRDASMQPIGYVTLALPFNSVTLERDIEGNQVNAIDILTFDSQGIPLISDVGLETVEKRIPANRALVNLTTDTGIVFQDFDKAGRERIYTVVPLVPGQVYTLGIWSVETWRIGVGGYVAAMLFPLLMWLASLAVAYIAVHRLVIRHIRSLRRNIRTFAATRRIRIDDGRDVPAELREVMDAFSQMTEQILLDEADQENLLHEKDVLLKEVHHRVKNNLQLIASMTNMQIRRAQHGETKFMLRRLQDRVMGLATVHRNLYQAAVLSEVRADTLISELARQLANSSIVPGKRIDFTLETEPVLLYPDQAVPLSLMLTEAVTNAFKYLGQPETGNPWVSVILRKLEQDTSGAAKIELIIANSTGPFVIEQQNQAVSGLGSQLISAFVMQLGGVSSANEDNGVYSVGVTFETADFTDDPDTGSNRSSGSSAG
ncbi:sensor histidine kinase [Oceaniovalibus sp. ACAM 378]|uniref:sensor histidine kinase n=1 Tax=Oceaniovalibus sp. ACAM 378 TaxID=2599923 RepID=UPI001652B4ED|nr:sensor histidine kinase [Oceaniovalibus sp. ACAM 378]